MKTVEAIGELQLDQRSKLRVGTRAHEVREGQNGPFLSCEIFDRTGSLPAKRFGPTAAERDRFKDIKYAAVDGLYHLFKGTPSFRIEAPVEPFVPDDLSKWEACSPLAPSDLRRRLDSHISSVHDTRLRAILEHVYRESDIAGKLFTLVNMVVYDMITAPREIAELYEDLPDKKLEGIENRDRAASRGTT